MTQHIYSIGHSTHDFGYFARLLTSHGITAVADVRSAPFSRFNPQFNRDSLIDGLRSIGVRYVFLGKELGARSEDPSCYEHGRVQYRRLAATAGFRSGIQRLMRGASEQKIALMCAEKEPLDCHRTILVAHELSALGVGVRNILGDGTVEEHEATMLRLLRLLKMPEVDLFRSREELLTEALARQEAKIAYSTTRTTDVGDRE